VKSLKLVDEKFQGETFQESIFFVSISDYNVSGYGIENFEFLYCHLQNRLFYTTHNRPRCCTMYVKPESVGTELEQYELFPLIC